MIPLYPIKSWFFLGYSPFLKISWPLEELSNFSWALATMDLCDNLMLRAIAEEVDRRGDEVNSWDPQSLSNMTLGYPIRGQGEGKHSMFAG